MSFLECQKWVYLDVFGVYGDARMKSACRDFVNGSKLHATKLLATIVSKSMEDAQSPHSLGEDIKESINQLLTQSKDGDGDNTIKYNM